MPALRAGIAAVVLALAVAGCGSSTSGTNNEGVTVAGSTLTIYASQPPGDQGGQTADDVFDAEKLAFEQSGARAGSYDLRFVAVHGDEVSADARDAVSGSRQTAIAYLGEIAPGTSGVSAQITNELGLLQVSPTDTSAYLTSAVPAVKGSPRHFFPAYHNAGATYASVAPSSVAETHAIAARMKARGVTSVTVADDGSDYGLAEAAELRGAAAADGISVGSGASAGGSGAHAAFYAGLPGVAARSALNADAAASTSVQLYAPSALYDDAFVDELSAAAQKALTVSAPGFVPADLDAVGRRFQQMFESEYHHTPAPQAIFGYEAVQAIVATLQEAGHHADERSVVVREFRDLHRSATQSALGAYVISGGATDLAQFVFATVADGRLVPHAAG